MRKELTNIEVYFITSVLQKTSQICLRKATLLINWAVEINGIVY